MFWIELFTTYAHFSMGFPGGSDGKESVLQCGTPGFDPWVRKIPWRRKWKPTPVFLPGEFHGQREPGGLHPMGSPRVRHDWATNTHTHTIFYIHSRQILPDPVNMCPFLGTSMIFYSISYLLFSTCWTTMIWWWHKIAMALYILIRYPHVSFMCKISSKHLPKIWWHTSLCCSLMVNNNIVKWNDIR